MAFAREQQYTRGTCRKLEISPLELLQVWGFTESPATKASGKKLQTMYMYGLYKFASTVYNLPGKEIVA